MNKSIRTLFCLTGAFLCLTILLPSPAQTAFHAQYETNRDTISHTNYWYTNGGIKINYYNRFRRNHLSVIYIQNKDLFLRLDHAKQTITKITPDTLNEFKKHNKDRRRRLKTVKELLDDMTPEQRRRVKNELGHDLTSIGPTGETLPEAVFKPGTNTFWKGRPAVQGTFTIDGDTEIDGTLFRRTPTGIGDSIPETLDAYSDFEDELIKTVRTTSMKLEVLDPILSRHRLLRDKQLRVAKISWPESTLELKEAGAVEQPPDLFEIPADYELRTPSPDNPLLKQYVNP